MATDMPNYVYAFGDGSGDLIISYESVFLDGMADSVSGDVEAPTGHFYRVNAGIVITDSRGFHYGYLYANEADAMRVFDILEAEYVDWCGADTEEI